MKYTYQIIIVLLLIALVVVWQKPVPAGSQLVADCPICDDCRITASKLIKDNPDIDYTQYNTATKIKLPDIEKLEVQIGKDIFTATEIKTLKK